MRKIKKFLVLLGLAAVFAIPVLATGNTLPPIYVGVRQLEEIPESWNPLEEIHGDQNAVLNLTGQPLYRLDETGAVVPDQAAELPVDVTAEFAGSFGIPNNARRGYAFAISLRPDARWEDGKPVSPTDWCFTLERLLEKDRFPLEIANYEAFLQGETRPAEQIISLKEAGYGSIAEAEDAGYRDFYIDLKGFWNLDTGWLRVTDRTPLQDAAIPSGCEEMHLTAEYLYRHYLGNEGSQRLFQSMFLGIPVSEGEKLTMDDVGLFVSGDRLVLILQKQTTSGYVACALTQQFPVPTGDCGDDYGTRDSYLSCGPYRIVSVSDAEIILEPNPHWSGEAAEFKIVCCRADG